MIVKNNDADQFVKHPPSEIAFFLVHGDDKGLVRERVAALIRGALGEKPDPLRLARLDGEALAEDPGRLSDEARAISMFGGSRLVWVETRGLDIAAALEPLFQAPPAECTIVVEAGSLKKSGQKLKAAFERAPGGASIECYPDGRRAIVTVIEEEARAGNLRVPPDVREALCDLLGADRMTTRGEIAKLMLYARGRGEVTLRDVEAIVSEAAPSMLDEAIDAAFAGDAKAADRAGRRYLANAGEATLLIGAAVRHAVLLHRLRAEVDSGRGFNGTPQSFGVIFQRRAAVERQIARWTPRRLGRLFTPLQAAAARVRQEPRVAEAAALRALWAIASSGRPGAA
jgi:DNA polymerase III subunit delta